MPYKLTDKTVRAAAPPATGNRIDYDTEIKGFGLRITAAGARSFVLNYRNRDAVARRLTIGSFPDWPVTEARFEAARLKRTVDTGGDPLQDRVDERTAPDVTTLAARYLVEHAEPFKRPASVRDDRRLIQRWIKPELGARKVELVSYGDIAELHRNITKHGTPTTANRCVALLSKMFNLARRWGWRRDGNPASGVARNQENRRDRPLTADEMARLLAASEAYPHRNAADAIMLLAMTGARSAEVLRATWGQFDLVSGIWIKPAAYTKQRRIHRVPLTAPALRLLEARVGAAATGKPCATDDLVFPGRLDGRPLTSIKRPWRAICAAAGIAHGRQKGITPHDLRHTFASMLGNAGKSLAVIGALLGHTQPATSMGYVHMFVDPLRTAAERVTAQFAAVPAKR